jgi:hypothetical protein
VSSALQKHKGGHRSTPSLLTHMHASALAALHHYLACVRQGCTAARQAAASEAAAAALRRVAAAVSASGSSSSSDRGSGGRLSAEGATWDSDDSGHAGRRSARDSHTSRERSDGDATTNTGKLASYHREAPRLLDLHRGAVCALIFEPDKCTSIPCRMSRLLTLFISRVSSEA